MTLAGARTWDALVIGAGPAGARAAQQLSTAGASTLLLEKQSLPATRLAAEGSPPERFDCWTISILLRSARAMSTRSTSRASANLSSARNRNVHSPGW
ncbi:MAG: FAD-dependent monooxygenase [Chloroflexi bacterium]|nr:FAD-dependent monooxygenase [Chloroflexota bacterium]MCY3589398.1 FAD-dependent monooxygenase [Chloroflexota bacterium]